MFVIGLLSRKNRETKAEVAIAVIYVTVGEHVASLYRVGFTHRFENVSAYVLPGRGMVYLTAIAMARSWLFQRYARGITACVITVCGAWASSI